MIPNTRGVSGGDHDDRAEEEDPVPPAPGLDLMRFFVDNKTSNIKKISAKSDKSPFLFHGQIGNISSIFLKYIYWKTGEYFRPLPLLYLYCDETRDVR